MQTLSPRTCPLCRQRFNLSRAYKLHVDYDYDVEEGSSSGRGGHLPSIEKEARRLEGELAAVSGDFNGDDDDGDCRRVIEEVVAWLDGFSLETVRRRALERLVVSNCLFLQHAVLRSFVSLLHRYKLLRGNLVTAQAELEENEVKRHKLKKALRKLQKEKEQDRSLLLGYEESWREKVTEMTSTYNKYAHHPLLIVGISLILVPLLSNRKVCTVQDYISI